MFMAPWMEHWLAGHYEMVLEKAYPLDTIHMLVDIPSDDDPIYEYHTIVGYEFQLEMVPSPVKSSHTLLTTNQKFAIDR